MPYHVINRTRQPLLLRLRSGRTLHLAAGARTTELDGAEINGNPRIASLIDRRMVDIANSQTGDVGDKASGGRTSRSRTTKRSAQKPDDAEATPAAEASADETPEGGSQ